MQAPGRLPAEKLASLVRDERSALDHMRFPAYIWTEDFKDSVWWCKRKGLPKPLTELGSAICERFARLNIPLYVCQYLDDNRSFGLAHCIYMDDLPDLCKQMIVHVVKDVCSTRNAKVHVDFDVLVVRVEDIDEDEGLFILDEGHFWKQDHNHRWYDTRVHGSGD